MKAKLPHQPLQKIAALKRQRGSVSGLQTLLNTAWYGDGIGAQLLALLLAPFSLIYCALNALDKRINLPSAKHTATTIKVLVVGNLSIGGTGKTPMVIHLSKLLHTQGYAVAVLTRGYGGRQAMTEPTQVLAEHTAQQVGDEAKLLAVHCPCPVWRCGSARNHAIALLAELGVDWVISDDGLQHYAMRHDAAIVMHDQRRVNHLPFMPPLCLPSGPYRESPQRSFNNAIHAQISPRHGALSVNATTASTSQVIHPMVIESGMLTPLSVLHTAKDDIARSTSSTPTQLPMALEDMAKLSETAEAHVVAIAALANNDKFFNLLNDHGIQLQALGFADHHRISINDMPKQATHIIMTEKDAVKCLEWLDQWHGADLLYLPIALADNLAFNEQLALCLQQ